MNTKHQIAALAMLAATSFASSALAYDARDVVRSTNGTILVNTFGNCLRTKWTQDDDACAPAQRVEYRKPRKIAEEERTVYFGFNKANLTPEAQTKLDSLAQAIRSESRVKDARIVGYADRMGSASYNEALSRKRAENVRKYLVAHQVVNASVAETRWFGETAPVTKCPNTLKRADLIACLQKDRRVEVEIDYLPEGEASGRR